MKKTIPIYIMILVFCSSLVSATFVEKMTAGDTYSASFEITENPSQFIFYINKTHPSSSDFIFSSSLDDMELVCDQNVLEWVCENPLQSNGILKINLTLNMALESGLFDYTIVSLVEENVGINMYQPVVISGFIIDENETENKTNNNDNIICEEEWICTEWNDCSEGFQIRKCKDSNACGEEEKPDEIRKCPVEEDVNDPLSGLFLLSSEEIITGSLVGIFIAMFVIYFFYRKKRTV